MRGGLERWKRGVDSRGVRQAISYALEGSCDAHLEQLSGADALQQYSKSVDAAVARFIVADGAITSDTLTAGGLRVWITGHDPVTGEERGTQRLSADADLILDGTVNAPKTYSVAALLHSELADAYEALQDRVRDQVLLLWQRELNARRGHAGLQQIAIRRLEVVELKHRRSRALDPHIHRHLWLNIKVEGIDGRWTNVDSRVAMKLHNVVNAEGELAARTDPEWVAALASRGFTLDADGEISQLAHTVRPLSRRSTQIETQRAELIESWKLMQPGEHPSRDVLNQIDRLAWSRNRPAKPHHLDESEWEHLAREEIAAIDPALLCARATTDPVWVATTDIDPVPLAHAAIIDADARSSATGGRFSRYDIRAGVLRAVAASRVIAPRADLQDLIDEAVESAEGFVLNLLDGEPTHAPHVKGYMAKVTVLLKQRLGERFDSLSRPGAPVPSAWIRQSERAAGAGVEMDDAQTAAAGAIGGTDRLVTVTGPAGTGKTTMLRAAARALKAQHRRLVLVSPTRKAANVAGREAGTEATSLHSLLADHGWTWTSGPNGAQHWDRVSVGEIDPRTDTIYAGPTRYALRPGDRIVVDEAGMVDLCTANALAAVAHETGAGIAMVGDPRQALPVGHSGAMASMERRSSAVVELDTVHRFDDPAYAALTLRLRNSTTPDDRFAVASELHESGHVSRVVSHEAALAAMVDAYFHWTAKSKSVALVVATNDDADTVSFAIQQLRLADGELNRAGVVIGRDQQRIYQGDVVQTRRNDVRAGVDNRALWTVDRVTVDTVELRSVSESGVVRSVSREYAGEHVHLAYASTVHGIQGETTDVAMVGPDVDAGGLYVGLTRGRERNTALVVARTESAAKHLIADALRRGATEVTIEDSIAAARAEARRIGTPPSGGYSWAPLIAAPMRGGISR